jgi:hypothetical protein
MHAKITLYIFLILLVWGAQEQPGGGRNHGEGMSCIKWGARSIPWGKNAKSERDKGAPWRRARGAWTPGSLAAAARNGRREASGAILMRESLSDDTIYSPHRLAINCYASHFKFHFHLNFFELIKWSAA